MKISLIAYHYLEIVKMKQFNLRVNFKVTFSSVFNIPREKLSTVLPLSLEELTCYQNFSIKKKLIPQYRVQSFDVMLSFYRQNDEMCRKFALPQVWILDMK